MRKTRDPIHFLKNFAIKNKLAT